MNSILFLLITCSLFELAFVSRESEPRRIFRLRSTSRSRDFIEDPTSIRYPRILAKDQDVRTLHRGHFNADHLLDDHHVTQPHFQLTATETTTTTTTTTTENPQRFRPRPVSVPGRPRRRQRKRMRLTTTTSTTTTTTTTQAPPDDYYEYDDYDYDDYHLTTTTTTTTASPRRRSGRRRFRRPTEPPTTTTTTTLSPNYKNRTDGRIIDYQADPNFPYELKGADLTEYPFYVKIPENDFNCEGRHDGYYANIKLYCQVYHHCAVGHQRYDFLCPNYTLFDQTTFTCRFVNSVNCQNSADHYARNNELYVTNSTESSANKN